MTSESEEIIGGTVEMTAPFLERWVRQSAVVPDFVVMSWLPNHSLLLTWPANAGGPKVGKVYS